MGYDGTLVGLAIHLSTGETVDPSVGRQWMASENGRRFTKLSGEAWYEANTAAAPTRNGHGRPPTDALPPTWDEN